jgi:hypothetical protein
MLVRDTPVADVSTLSTVRADSLNFCAYFGGFYTGGLDHRLEKVDHAVYLAEGLALGKV